MKVWALIDDEFGIMAVLNEHGKRDVEKQLVELGRKEVKSQVDGIEDSNMSGSEYTHLMNLLNSDDSRKLIPYTYYRLEEFNVESGYEVME